MLQSQRRAEGENGRVRFIAVRHVEVNPGSKAWLGAWKWEEMEFQRFFLVVPHSLFAESQPYVYRSPVLQ